MCPQANIVTIFEYTNLSKASFAALWTCIYFTQGSHLDSLLCLCCCPFMPKLSYFISLFLQVHFLFFMDLICTFAFVWNFLFFFHFYLSHLFYFFVFHPSPFPILLILYPSTFLSFPPYQSPQPPLKKLSASAPPPPAFW